MTLYLLVFHFPHALYSARGFYSGRRTLGFFLFFILLVIFLTLNRCMFVSQGFRDRSIF